MFKKLNDKLQYRQAGAIADNLNEIRGTIEPSIAKAGYWIELTEWITDLAAVRPSRSYEEDDLNTVITLQLIRMVGRYV